MELTDIEKLMFANARDSDASDDEPNEPLNCPTKAAAANREELN